MMAPFHRSRSLLCLVGGLSAALFCLIVVPTAGAASSSSTSSPAKRWVQFDLNEEESAADILSGKPITLSMVLGGVNQGGTPVVAILESVHFESQTFTLEADATPMTLKGTVTLEPMPPSRTSVPPKVARIQVTFARARQDKLERFMRRVIYVTLDPQAPSNESLELPPGRAEELRKDDIVVDEVQPEVEPVSIDTMAEEDLMPLPEPGQGTAYWQHVSHLVSRSWARHVRGLRHGPSTETVKVRFKLYPNGRAQLIEIEKGSGAREIDEAGIYSVVHAQPFPPFPSELGDDAVDVHLRMRIGARSRSRGTQSVTNPSSSKPDVPASKQ